MAEIERAVRMLPGNAYEFTQPIQMRFNELLAGVRGDIAVKVFGDEFDPLLQAANQIAGILRGVEGAADVRVEQVVGLPVLEIAPDKAEIARRGLSLSTVQEVIGAAIGGREAGAVYEGDRHFDIVVRLGEAARSDIDALKNLPVPLPPNAAGQIAGSIPLSQVARFRLIEGPNQISRENGKRRVVVTANVRARHRLGGGGCAGAHQGARQPAAGLLADLGRTVREPRRRAPTPDDRGAGCFALIFLLLVARSARPATRCWCSARCRLRSPAGRSRCGCAACRSRFRPRWVHRLSGIAVLNGLVMLSLITQLMRQGRSRRDAIVEGALTRLRPVVMTALVASLGFVPMASPPAPARRCRSRSRPW